MDRRKAIRSLAAVTALPFISTPEFASLLEARRTLSCTGSSLTPFVPAALDPYQLAMVKTVSDIILPATDTPGASDVGVPEFIDLIVSEWFDPAESERFLGGLSALDGAASGRFGQAFERCDLEQQTTLVAELDQDLAQRRANEDSDVGRSFFHWMKRLTLTGYFTSEEGMAALQYRRIPGAFEGCLVPEPAQ